MSHTSTFFELPWLYTSVCNSHSLQNDLLLGILEFSFQCVQYIGWLTVTQRWGQSSQKTKYVINNWLFFSSQGDYDVVINDYEKAKSLFGNTEVPVFKKGKHFSFPESKLVKLRFSSLCEILLCYSAQVYAEVETRIQALRHLLLEKLLQTPSTLHDQKRYIRFFFTSLTFWQPCCLTLWSWFVIGPMNLSWSQAELWTRTQLRFTLFCGWWEVCVCVCKWVSLWHLLSKDSHSNKKQMSHHFI